MIMRIGLCGKSAAIPIGPHGKRNQNPKIKIMTLAFLMLFSPFLSGTESIGILTGESPLLSGYPCRPNYLQEGIIP
jgi:hypothetical protein